MPPHTAPPVLVVDDDADTAWSLAELCRLNGYPARHAGSGAEALALAADDPPAVVLLDVYMPGMDGCELARRLTRALAVPPLLIAVSGRATAADRARTAAAGCHGHLLKPVPPAVVVGLLRRVAEAWPGAARPTATVAG